MRESYVILEKIKADPYSATLEELTVLLKENDEEFNGYLFKTADEVRREYVGDEVHIRALMEFSNYCRRDCKYCGLRRSNRKLRRYRMKPEEIVQRARMAAEMGARTIVLQSGEDLTFTAETIADMIKEIKKFDVAVTLSLGERDYREYKLWKDSGADRYLMRHETANPELYKKLHPDSRFEERLKCLKILRELGYEVGAGSMVGLPGQTARDMAMDLIFTRDMDCDMVGIGPFIPHPDTPLAHEKPGDFIMCLKMVALTRILIPDSNIPATTAMGTIKHGGREITLQCGANVIMPNLTPTPYRALYQLYPGKICVFESDVRCLPCVKMMIERLNRKVGTTYGNRVKKKAA